MTCETVAAIVRHLRADDGVVHPTGGLDTSKILCPIGRPAPKRGRAVPAPNGWDLPLVKPPASPAHARLENEQRPTGLRWCSACLTAWDNADKTEPQR